MGRMHSDAQFAGSSSVPAHVDMMGLIGMGNNPMVGATVACAVAVNAAINGSIRVARLKARHQKGRRARTAAFLRHEGHLHSTSAEAFERPHAAASYTPLRTSKGNGRAIRRRAGARKP